MNRSTAATLTVLVCSLTHAAEPPKQVDYVRDIKPLLRNKCSTCHGVLKQEGDLRLDAGKLIHDGEVVRPGKPNESELLRRMTATDKEIRMPLEGSPLSADQIALVRAWITQGAKFPAGEPIATSPEQHWSFQPIKSPPVARVKRNTWPLNEIDHFVLARLEEKGWTPNASAEPGQLIRRAHLDLIGLPPTLAEQDKFAKNPNMDELVTDLLNRKGYGERYARHWLDVVRYADSNGYERDAAKPEVWRYRDYVIQALNEDKTFDHFILEQLAGDEMHDANTNTVIATGFNRLGAWDDEPADFALDRFDQLDDIVNTTSQAFLGLTMGCARCHNHKFDPLLQTDYYSMVAIFNPLKRPQNGRRELSRYAATPELAAKLKVRDDMIASEKAALRTLKDSFAVAIIEAGESQLPQDVQDAVLAGEKRNDEQKKLVAAKLADIDKATDSKLNKKQRRQLVVHEERIGELFKNLPSPPQGYFMFEASPTAPITHLLKRGNPSSLGEVVPPAVPRVLVSQQPKMLAPTEFTSRRRLSFAQWMVDPSNPLTARVIVNRVWQWHFGTAIVRTPNDFGLIGERPTHPLLLDWLAQWFVHKANWSLKKLHHLIMTSRTYQMSSHARKEQFEADPDNLLLWRHAPHRLEIEAIRDSVLAVSGRLSRKMYGPPMYPYVPKEALLNHADKTSIWPAFNEDEASRRTIYAFIKRSLLVPFLEVLDLCDVTQTSPKRKVTTVPTQALTLFNGNFVIRQSQHFAKRLVREAGEKPEDQIRLSLRLSISREPSDRELEVMKDFLADQLAEIRTQPNAKEKTEEQQRFEALTQLCRVVYNLNEFVYPE